ncbi:MAG TPA: glycosyltransferase family 4 protein [Candidatus Saccharimonadales bacterium]|nr:glycosyltransferase family 4 protein [Candidatus Saccharimonadales bacterium]
MKILWLTWKDHKHPAAGGAEVISRELTTRLAADGHRVTLLTCGYAGAPRQEMIDGVQVIRIGSNRYAHPLQASFHYLRRLQNKFDIVIEEVNAAPYFSVFFGKQAKRFLFYHHLEREVWLHEAPAPVNYLGYYLLEPIATKILSRAKVPLITVSESTKQDLAKYGFDPRQTHIISEGIELEPVKNLEQADKYARPTMLSLGAMRAMKRTLDQVKAFEIAKKSLPDLELKVAGDSSGPYGKQVLDYIQASPHGQDITYLGRVSKEHKLELMRRSHLIGVTSVKEGWGLIVTEAASQGTPSVAYDVPGLRDSVRHGQTGLITSPQPAALAGGIVKLLRDTPLYDRLRHAGWQWSKQITFEQSYKDLKSAIGIV